MAKTYLPCRNLILDAYDTLVMTELSALYGMKFNLIDTG